MMHDFYQPVLKRRHQGESLDTTAGTTDVTNEHMHADIKYASDWLVGYRRLLGFYNVEPRPELRLYLYHADAMTPPTVKKMFKTVAMGTLPMSIYYLDEKGQETLVFNAKACWGELSIEKPPSRQDVIAQRLIANLSIPIESFAAALQNGLIPGFTRGELYEHVKLHVLQDAARRYWNEQMLRVLDVEHWISCLGVYIERLIDKTYFHYTADNDYRLDLRKMHTFRVSDIINKRLKRDCAINSDHLL